MNISDKELKLIKYMGYPMFPMTLNEINQVFDEDFSEEVNSLCTQKIIENLGTKKKPMYILTAAGEAIYNNERNI